jgi:hypothetical protein
MTTEQMGLGEYIKEVERPKPILSKWPSVPTSLYCRLTGYELVQTARAAEKCPDYIAELYIGSRVRRSCVFCRHSVNPKVDPSFKIPENENAEQSYIS